MLTAEAFAQLTGEEQDDYLSVCRLEYEEGIRAPVLGRAASDIVWWVNEWVWTYDPRLEGEKYIPFTLYPRQVELLRWLEERKRTQTDGLVEKGRDLGLTWLSISFLIHEWLFEPGFKGSVGSRKQELLDGLGNPDTIFEKIRILLRRLPSWMMPVGFDWKKHDNFCRLLNPATLGTISGESGDEIGRGGRSSFYFVDEAAFLERPERIEAALSGNTNVRIYVSTHNGPTTVFNRKLESGSLAVFRFTWKDDPRKNHWQVVDGEGQVMDSGLAGTEPSGLKPAQKLIYPWYEAECRRLRDPVIIAQEIEADPSGSVEDICIPFAWVKSAVDLDKRFDMPGGECFEGGLDVADSGPNLSVLVARCGPVVTGIHERRSPGTTDTANWALEKAEAEKITQLNYDVAGVGAGVAGTFSARDREGSLPLSVYGVNVGVGPSKSCMPDGRTALETFANYKAELWWQVRQRFEKTFELVEQGVEHPLDECISIPDNPELIRQLSNIKYVRLESGKKRMESKIEMRHRGAPSPDHADALVLAFAGLAGPVRILTGSRKRELVRQGVSGV